MTGSAVPDVEPQMPPFIADLLARWWDASAPYVLGGLLLALLAAVLWVALRRRREDHW